MKRLAIAIALISLAIAPGIAAGSSDRDSVRMSATVVESCTISQRSVSAGADAGDRRARGLRFDCSGDAGQLDARVELGRSAAGEGPGASTYRVHYETTPSSVVATIIF